MFAANVIVAVATAFIIPGVYLIGIPLVVFFAGLGVTISYLVARWPNNNPACPNCGYDLRGSKQSSNCPKCGNSIPASFVRTRLPDQKNIETSRPSLSLDVKIVAYFHMVVGLLSYLGAALIWLAGLSTTFGGPPPSPPPFMITAFGLFTVEGSWQVGVYMLALGTVTFIAGLCVLRRRRFGWFLLLLLQVNGIVSGWLAYARDGSSAYFYSAVVWSVLAFVFATVLIFRRKQFFASWSRQRCQEP